MSAQCTYYIMNHNRGLGTYKLSDCESESLIPSDLLPTLQQFGKTKESEVNRTRSGGENFWGNSKFYFPSSHSGKGATKMTILSFG